MNERIKEARKALNLTQREFASRVGVKDNAISRIESGERNLTEHMLLALCKEYDINEAWLRTGEGEMFVVTKNDLIHQLSKQYELNALDQKLVEIYISLPKAHREVLRDFALKLMDAASAPHSDMEAAKEFAPTALDEEGEEWSEFNKGLTEEQAIQRVRNRYAASKKGDALFTTSAKDGSDSTMNLKRIEGL